MSASPIPETSASTGDAKAARPRSGGIPYKRREDLVVTRQRFDGLTYFVILDPLNLAYYRFRPPEYAVFEMFDGNIDVESIVLEFERRFAPQRLRADDVKRFLSQCLRTGLVVSTAITVSPAAPNTNRRGPRRPSGMRAILANPLAIEIRRWKADDFLKRCLPYLGRLFGPAATLSYLAAVGWAFFFLISHRTAITAALPSADELLDIRRVPSLLAAMSLGLTIRGFIRGLACKHFVGSCRYFGLFIIFFTPALNFDATSTYSEPSVIRRIRVLLAALQADVALALAGALGWWFTSPGIVHDFCLHLALSMGCLFLFVQLPPFAFGDGYFLLCDWLQVPNLRDRGQKALRGRLAEIFFGVAAPDDPFPTRQLRAAVFIGALNYAYRVWFWLIIFVIIDKIMKSTDLPWPASALPCLVVGVLVVLPLTLLARYLVDQQRRGKLNAARFVAWMVILTMISGAIWLLPIDRVATTTVTIEPTEIKVVTMPADGRIERMLVGPGDVVDAGQPLFSFRAEREPRDSASPDTIRSPAAGRIVARAGRSDGGGFDSDFPVDPSPSGAPIREGEAICRLVDAQAYWAVCRLSEEQAHVVADGELEIAFDSVPDRVWRGRVAQVTVSRSENAEIGPQPLYPAAAWSAVIRFEDPDRKLQPWMRGRGRIQLPPGRLGPHLWNQVVDFLYDDR